MVKHLRAEGWLYLAVVIDLISRQIDGWAMDDRMKIQLEIEMPWQWLPG